MSIIIFAPILTSLVPHHSSAQYIYYQAPVIVASHPSQASYLSHLICYSCPQSAESQSTVPISSGVNHRQLTYSAESPSLKGPPPTTGAVERRRTPSPNAVERRHQTPTNAVVRRRWRRTKMTAPLVGTHPIEVPKFNFGPKS